VPQYTYARIVRPAHSLRPLPFRTRILDRSACLTKLCEKIKPDVPPPGVHPSVASPHAPPSPYPLLTQLTHSFAVPKAKSLSHDCAFSARRSKPNSFAHCVPLIDTLLLLQQSGVTGHYDAWGHFSQTLLCSSMNRASVRSTTQHAVPH